MNKQELLTSIQADLGANYQSTDGALLGALLDEVIDDALFISNRRYLVNDEDSLNNQLAILRTEIRKAVKSIYLQRGTEDTTSQSMNGMSGSYPDPIEVLKKDIISTGKRLML